MWLLGGVAIFSALCLWGRRRRTLLGRALCARYDLDPQLGFMPGTVAGSLPRKFAAWDRLAASLPYLNHRGRLRPAVDAMPTVLVTSGCLSIGELRRARVLLTHLAHSYVHGAAVPWERLRAVEASGCVLFEYISSPEPPAPPPPPLPALPAQLAIPWAQVSGMLGMPLVLTASDTDLWNCDHISKEYPPDEAMDRFRQLVSMTGTRSERGFHALPFAIQLTLAPLLPSLLDAPRCLQEGDHANLTDLCERMAAALREVRQLLQRVYAEVDRDEFYDAYRLLLSGFTGLKLSGVPGISGEEEVTLVGPSAGQTALLMLIDTVMGVQHTPAMCAAMDWVESARWVAYGRPVI